MKLKLLFFAGLREALDTREEAVEVPAEVATAGDLQRWLSARGGAWEDALAPGRAVRVAVDQSLGGPDTALHDGAEVAFFPPVTGG